jgi:hypothetical protein
MTMAKIPVLFFVTEEPAKGGLVKKGATPTTAQSRVGTAIAKAIQKTISTDQLVDGVRLGGSLKTLAPLSNRD